MKILFIGDIVGRIGRKTVAKLLPKIKKGYKIDLVFANAENAAHGSGVTEPVLKELQSAGIDYFTSGDHVLKNNKSLDLFEKYPILRPANCPPGVQGQGYVEIEKNGQKILLINLIGRIFMKNDYDCPFRKIDEILANYDLPSLQNFAIIIDIHAEATSEKACLFRHLDGKITAILGTHTHVQTADAEISQNKTAFISDLGMVGFKNGSLGVEASNLIKEFYTQIKHSHVIPKKGEAVLNAAILEFSNRDKKAKSLKPLFLTTKIN